MEKYVKFEVPAEVLGDFVQEVSSRGMSATTSGTNRRGEHIVTVPYEKDEEDQVDELKEYLDDLISEASEDEDEDEDEEEDGDER